ncbi:MAG: hypothetical protein WD929_07115 [Steroidobacteraceae bacterium]
MSIQFQVEEHDDCLRLECTGTYSIEEISRLYRESFVLAARAGRDALLLDVRQVTGREPTLTERYDLGVLVADLQANRTPRIRMAVLGNEPMIHPERFGEIIATNRGAVARMFTDEKTALDWLVARPKPR